MKNAFTFLRILRAIWPEVKALIHHIQHMLPEEEHVPALKHVLKESKQMVDTDKHAIIVGGWPRAREHQLEDFDLENF